MTLKKIQKKSYEETVEKGIRRDQATRLLEDVETLSLTVRLLEQAVSGFRRDFEGMLNGNKGGTR